MVRRRCDYKPEPKFSFWKREGKVYFADVQALKKEIELSGIPEETMRKNLGVGYTHLEDALIGKPISYWEMRHVEHGLTTKDVPGERWLSRDPK
jgi:hypothetical protein